jgi:DNA polymerase III delta prime subunit
MPVLWLAGPAGVGKSAASWQLFTELADSGIRVAFADTDQLCMCYPAPPGDPGREDIKARNAGAAISNFRAAGAQCVIANGVLDPAAGLRAELLPQAAVTICRLRARADEVERRFVARHGQQDDTAELLQSVRTEASLLDQSSFADACVDTTDVPEIEVAARVRDACRDWPGFSGALPESAISAIETARPPAGGEVLLLTGPTGVGKSTIGFQFYLDCLNAGFVAGYVDLGQIGFLRPGGASDPRDQSLGARNLAAIWRTYRSAGASRLVVTGHIDSEAEFQCYARELPGAQIALCRLRAEREELTRRILSRGAGGSWPEPGDSLRGQPAGFLRAVANRVWGQEAARGQAWLGGLSLDTDGHTPREAASLLASATGWHEPARSHDQGMCHEPDLPGE